MVAVEMAVRTLVSGGFRDCHVVIRSDNQGVVGALRAGKSRNSQQNLILRKIVSLFQDHKLWVTVNWVATKDNIADDPSRGKLPPVKLCYAYPPAIPVHLKQFLYSTIS